MDKGLKLILFLFMLPLAVATAAGKKPISEKQMSAYLMVFHRDDTHSLYMALSRAAIISQLLTMLSQLLVATQ